VTVGVLALQGDFAAHARVLSELGAAVVPVRTAADLASIQALVIPGGESTAILRLMESEDLDRVIGRRVAAGMPLLATCAGMILVAARVEPAQPCLGLVDIDVIRNGYGRQVHSRVVDIEAEAELGGPPSMEGVFIRAPRVTRVGPGVRVLARRGEDAVALRQGRVIAASFHPELTVDRRLHWLFLRAGEENDGRAIGA
jgi:5'-phosphate synthase pdxT subunit